MWSDHMRLEERSLALHEESARRLSASPELIEIAKENIARWSERDGELPPWKEWKEILGRSLAEVVGVLTAKDEKARHLKNSLIAGCGKMSRCKAPEILRSEAYMGVRRSDEGRGQRRSQIPRPSAGRWAFFSNLLNRA